MSLLSKSNIINEMVTKRINKLQSENMPIEEIKPNVLVYFKQYDSRTIWKIIESVLEQKAPKKAPKKVEEPKKQKAPKKVNRIDPKDERVSHMELGSYANALTNDGSGIKNKYFWQCVKCDKIYQQREEAVECFDMIGSIRTVQSNNKHEIDDLSTITVKGSKYSVKITNRQINESYNSSMGFHNPMYNWYYDKQRQYIYSVEVLEQLS